MNVDDSQGEFAQLEKTLAELVAESRRLEAAVEAIKSNCVQRPPPAKSLFAGAHVVTPGRAS
jgi:hypothetical protein